MANSLKDIHINTDTTVKNDGVPRQPNDRDESPDSQTAQPQKKMKQAHADIERGLVDTDLHGTPGVEAIKNPQPVVPAKKKAH